MKRFIVRSVLCLAVAAARPSLAAEPTKATQAEAQKFSKAVLPVDVYKEKLDRMVQAIQQAQAAARKKPMSDDFWKKLRASLDTALPYQEMLDDGAVQFAKHYTADELKRLLTFYQSPLGQKALKVMPQVMAEASAEFQKHMEARLPGILQGLIKDEAPQAGDASAIPPQP